MRTNPAAPYSIRFSGGKQDHEFSSCFGTEMHIDPALLSALSALVGALTGGTASLLAAIYTQRRQDRLQRLGREATKREEVYADFIMSASKVLLNAYVHDGVTLTGDGQHLAGLLNRMRLFAPPNVIDEAEAVIRWLVEISLKPSVEFPKVAAEIVQGPAIRSASTIQRGLPGGS